MEIPAIHKPTIVDYDYRGVTYHFKKLSLADLVEVANLFTEAKTGGERLASAIAYSMQDYPDNSIKERTDFVMSWEVMEEDLYDICEAIGVETPRSRDEKKARRLEALGKRNATQEKVS